MTETTRSTPATSVPESTTSTASPGSFDDQELPGRLERVTGAWSTDFSNATVDLNELLVGIPSSDPRDAIPPIDSPNFASVDDSAWIGDREPGVVLEIEGEARFYPLSVMTRHEIVNDEFGDLPVAVTYCPLCNTAVTFDRRLNDDVLRLGVSGLLRNSDLVMWDDVTQTLWQQIKGEGIVGELAGEKLTLLPTAIVSWADFKEEHPDGRALSDDQGFGIPYGLNPYEFYSSRSAPYNFFSGEIDDRYPALERVVGVTVGESSKAYAFSDIAEERAVNDSLGGMPIVVFWGSPDTADALDSRQIAESQGVGTGVAFSAAAGGEDLTFEASEDGNFRDVETGSTWNIFGRAIEGPLAGERLELLTHRNEFWFAWQAFFPESEVWEATGPALRLASLDRESHFGEWGGQNPSATSRKPYRR